MDNNPVNRGPQTIPNQSQSTASANTQTPQPLITVNPVPAPASAPNEPSLNKVSKLKLLEYFLIGFFTNFFGWIIAGVWIAIKVKENKKPRFISLTAGLITAIIVTIIISQSPLIQMLQKKMVDKYPEIAYIPEGLKSYFPDSKISVGIEKIKNLVGSEANTTTSVLTVSITSNTNLTGEQRKTAAMVVCNLLAAHDTSYTTIKIDEVQVKRIFIFKYNQDIFEERSCLDWKEKPAYEMEFPFIPQN